jgi:hypothetical protein
MVSSYAWFHMVKHGRLHDTFKEKRAFRIGFHIGENASKA